MASKRKLIRHAVTELLINKTAAEDRVYASRPTPLWTTETDSICVYTKDEDAEEYNDTPVEEQYTLILQIECVVKANKEADDNLDDMTEIVKEEIYKSKLFPVEGGGTLLSEQPHLKKTAVSLVTDGTNTFASAVMSWKFVYTDIYPQPDEDDNFTLARSAMTFTDGRTEGEIGLETVLPEE